jgi:outer membrane lipoprotein-sorting protein
MNRLPLTVAFASPERTPLFRAGPIGHALTVGLALIVLLSSAALALADDWSVAALMAELAQHKTGTAHFVETRYLAVLDAPLVSSGELSFSAPDKFVKSTLRPKPERLELDGDTVQIDRGRQHLSVELGEHPELGALVESIRATLNGDRQVLEQNYAVTLSGTRQKWVLGLVPRDARVLAVISRVTLSGSGGLLGLVEYQQADGDRSVMAIDNVGGQ